MQPSPLESARSGWRVTDPARTLLTRLAILALALVALDGAVTWYVTDRASDVVAEVEQRDGVVALDDSDLGMHHDAEITRAVGSDRDRVRRGALKWIPASLMALGAGLFTSRADPALRRSLVMVVALTLAIWVAPRIVYSSELRVLDSVLG